jgi:NAD(P)-dependent dehydrogenase (short-subunit alcohol dehydrogenase family)
MAGKRVLITGGGRGIGRAIALNMASRGASGAVLSRTSGEVEAVVAEARAVAPAPDEAVLVALTADVTDEASVSSSIRAAKAALGGGIDVLVNNAGRASAAKGSLWEQRADDFRGLMDTNVLSVFLVSRAVLNEGGMLEAGRGDIINVSSKAGKVGLPGMGPYVASKHAVEGLTATLAKELAAVAEKKAAEEEVVGRGGENEQGEGKEGGMEGGGGGEESRPMIRVNSISPGMVDTRSFPKAPGRPGVRSAESSAAGIDLLLFGSPTATTTTGGGAGSGGSSGGSGLVTGHYVHVDELDAAIAAGKDPAVALKPIDEPAFVP